MYKSPVIREEGRQLLALIKAKPAFHAPAPTPEQQDMTTAMEKFAAATFQELECYAGSIGDQCASAQIHEKIGWIYLGMRRDYYGSPPAETGDILYDARAYDDYKKEAGISAVFEERFVPSSSMYWAGDHWNPNRVYEIKTVDEFDLIAEYNIKVSKNGEWSMPDVTTLPSGENEEFAWESNRSARSLRFIEYWDREWCFLICINPQAGWFKKDQTVVLDSWQHGWGRVPYFCRPAFESDQTAEEKKFESPLDGLYTEIKTYNRVRTIWSSVSYNTGFAPLKIITKEGNDLIMDDNGRVQQKLEFNPGEPVQLMPGQDLLPVILSPEANILQDEIQASEARILQFSLSSIARGVSPGSDTANSALTTLRRQQKSSLQTLNENQARQYREMTKFIFQRIMDDIGETVYVFDQPTSDRIPLGPQDIVTLNMQVKCDADVGQDLLIEEKQALESYLNGAITEQEYHERRGKSNPEEYVRATALDRLRRSFEPELFDGIKALFGQSSALARLVAANRQSGQAEDAIPDILNTISGLQNPSGNGMGEGSGMMPRQEGVRSPSLQETTTLGGAAGQYAGVP